NNKFNARAGDIRRRVRSVQSALLTDHNLESYPSPVWFAEQRAWARSCSGLRMLYGNTGRSPVSLVLLSLFWQPLSALNLVSGPGPGINSATFCGPISVS